MSKRWPEGVPVFELLRDVSANDSRAGDNVVGCGICPSDNCGACVRFLLPIGDDYNYGDTHTSGWHASIDDVRPLNADARAMLAIAKAGSR